MDRIERAGVTPHGSHPARREAALDNHPLQRAAAPVPSEALEAESAVTYVRLFIGICGLVCRRSIPIRFLTRAAPVRENLTKDHVRPPFVLHASLIADPVPTRHGSPPLIPHPHLAPVVADRPRHVHAPAEPVKPNETVVAGI